MVRRAALCHRLVGDARSGGQVAAQLTRLALVDAAVVAPEVGVACSVGFRVELEDGDSRLLAVAGLQPEVADRGLGGAVGALVDPPAGPLLGRRVGIESGFAVDAFEHDASVSSLQQLFTWS